MNTYIKHTMTTQNTGKNVPLALPKEMNKHIVLQQHGHSGYESCVQGNSYTKICTCGYSEIGHKPCVWDGYSYRGLYQARSHLKQCSVCESDIMYSYYYNGMLYIEEEKKEAVIPEYSQMERCSDSNGNIISCTSIGTCTKCKGNYPEEYKLAHYLSQQEDNKITCVVCKKEFGTMDIDIKNNSNIPMEYIVTVNIKFTNGMAFSRDPYLYFGYTSGIFEQETIDVTYINDNRTDVILKAKIKFNSTFKGKVNIASVQFHTKLNNSAYESHCQTKYFLLKSDLTKPEISNIQLSGNEWTKSKPITITGTENWTNTVNIKIENDRGRVVYEGDANVTNNNWSISCTPEIEAGEESRVFTVTVTDACENSTTKNFEVSKVDGRPPTVTSSDKVTDNEWAREKTFTFTAEDLGIGNVEIGFNNVNDYSPAVKDGNNYSKEYKFVGNAYSPVQASVYFKDGLGNITTQVVTLEKIDNTAPTITNAMLNNNVINITAHDRHAILGEGSGVVKYRYITSTEKLENPQITENNSQEIGKDEILTIPNISEVKYIYIVAEDLVGNISESYEIEVPQLELTSQVNPGGANGKGTVLLDWLGYDIANKYFVIYRKQKDEEEWKTIVGIDAKMNNNTYTDLLGNDTAKPNIPEITIEKDLQAGQIKINQTAIDSGTTYTYYIESYDQTTGELISKSNTN